MTEDAESLVSGINPDPGYRERYPWHAELWSRVACDLSRLPHALLLHGPRGLGKRAFASRLAQVALCSARASEQACGACSNCRRFEAGTHPDLLQISPVEDSTTINIDQVRALRDFVGLTPHTAARKVVILEPADAMNLNAANALLKLLEEPPQANILLLVTAFAARLPPTIRSRCVGVAFRTPERTVAAAWLAEQGIGNPSALLDVSAAPLQALSLSHSSDLQSREQLHKDLAALSRQTEDPLRCAVRWKSYGLETCLSWIQEYLSDLIRRNMVEQKIGRGLRELFAYLDLISETKGLLGGALDEALLLEDLAIRWTRTSRSMG